MKHSDIRKAFISYFGKHGHQHVESSSLIPHNDPTLLFTNAGMNQFKNVFLGSESLGFDRAVTIQKCVRAGGKHNDLENVGYTTRHHTFFEMLGNFSFGDYFKKEAIHFAWEFLTKELQIPKEKLHVTVFETDDEAAQIWHEQEGVPKEKILRCGEKDNFWRMGETGPCGPCSEIFYDHGPEAAKDPSLPFGQDEDRYVEIWNLVFMQYFEDENKKLTPLPKPSVDTGAGLERLAAVMQNETDNYYTDLFTPLIETACKEANLNFAKWDNDPKSKATFKVVSDHARATIFLMSDGVLPGNEGRSYVLRRIMRRAIRYTQKLTEDPKLFTKVCKKVIKEMKDFYPQLDKKLLEAVELETDRFMSTLSQGTQILENHLKELKKFRSKTVDGKTAFKLYDTFGFPVDLTQLIAKEHGFDVNLEAFQQELEKARQVAKQARKSHKISTNEKHLAEWTSDFKPTEFKGYTHLELEKAKVLGLSNGEQAVDTLSEGQSGVIIFDESPFYAEGGGQVGDQGHFYTDAFEVEVEDCTQMNGVFLHHVTIKKGTVVLKDKGNLHVLVSSRRDTARNHSATHLLHKALKDVLGESVGQAGSLVTAEKLRFDFTHNAAVSKSELEQVEQLVNEKIFQSLEVSSKHQPYKKAVAEGAVAMFGEKYSDEVRVISMGGFSKELCGGTHVANTSEIGLFKIVAESSISSGVRRIEALTGRNAFTFLNKNTQENTQARQVANLPTNWEKYLYEDTETTVHWMKQAQEQIQALKKDMQALQSESIDVSSLLKNAKTHSTSKGDITLLVEELNVEDRKVMSQIMDQLRDRSQNLVAVLVGSGVQKPLLVGANKSLKHVHCGQLTKQLTEEFGGKGGGRPDFAQGSVEKFDKSKGLGIIQAALDGAF